MKTEQFISISDGEAVEINGGGFAFDAGRVVRFLYISVLGSSMVGTAMAVTDWQINAMVNAPAE